VSEDQKQNALLSAFERNENKKDMDFDDPEFLDLMKFYRMWKKMRDH